MIKNLIKRLVWKYKSKLIIVAILISLIIGVFTALNNSQVYIANNINTLHEKYNSFDFKFDKQNASLDQIEKFSKKYKFNYKIEDIKSNQFDINLKKNDSFILVNPDDSKAKKAKFKINFIKQRKNSYAKPYLLSGNFASKNDEINVTKDFLAKTGYQLNDNVTLQDKKYKIVGVFADQNNQSINEVENVLTNAGEFDVIVSNENFATINANDNNVVMARFKQNLNYEQRLQIYKKMSNDSEFTFDKNVDKTQTQTQNVNADINNYCGINEFNGYLNNKNLSQSNFEYFKQKAQDSLKADNKCTIDVSNDLSQRAYESNSGGIISTKPIIRPSQSSYQLSPLQLKLIDELNLQNYNLDNVSKGILVDSINKFLKSSNPSDDDIKNLFNQLNYNKLVSTTRSIDEFNNANEQSYNSLKESSDYSQFVNDIKNIAKAFNDSYIPKAKEYKVTYLKNVGTTKVKTLVFNSFNDIVEINGSKQMFIQLQKQQTLIIYLGIIFTILLILVTSIVISQIIKSINIEIGTLKAIGASNKFITNKFMSFVRTLIVLVCCFSIISISLFQVLIINFYNEKFAIVNQNIFVFDYIINPIIYIFIIGFIYIFGKKSLKRIINDDTLLLLKNLNSLKSIFKILDETKRPKFGKFWNEIVVKNSQKTTIIFFIGIIMSIFAGTLMILFSDVSSYLAGGNGSQVSNSTKVILNKESNENILSNSNYINISNIEADNVVTKKANSTANASKTISKIDPISISVLGIEKSTIKSDDGSNNFLVDTRSISSKSLDSGIVLAKKYHDLYKLNVGDKLEFIDPKTQNSKLVNISGFLNENENIFAYTSNSYLQSINDNKREVNAMLQMQNSNVTKQILNDVSDSKLNVEGLKSIKINKNQEIVALIVQALFVLTIILLPIIVIIVSDIVDSNTKTIATMRAIGISKFKIRLSIIQPYSIIYMLGAFIGTLIVISGFASQFSTIFYSFINVDVTYFTDFYILIGVLVIIWLIYETVISIAFTRISVISLSKTLNDDSARTQITKDDLRRFYKSSAKSLLDFNKKPFYYKPTKIAKLKKPVSRSFWVEFAKYVWPIYAAKVIQSLVGITTMVTAFLLTFIPSQTLTFTPEVQICLGFVTGGWILGTWKEQIIQVAITYATQYYRQNKKSQFKRSIAFAVQISLFSQLLIILGIILFGQLGMQSTDIPLSAYQFLGVGIFAAFVQQVIDSFSLPYTSAITASGDTKINIANDVIGIFTTVIGAALTLVFAFTKDIDIYLYTFFVVIITSIGKFVPIIYGSVVKRHKQWAGGTWKYIFSFRHPVNSRILNKSIPYIISSIFEQLASWIKSAIFALLGLTLLVENPGELVDTLSNLNWFTKINLPDMINKLFNHDTLSGSFGSSLVGKTTILALIIGVYKTLSIFNVFESMNYFMTRILARRNYFFAVQLFNNVVKNIVLFLIGQAAIVILISIGAFELFQGSGANSVLWSDVNLIIIFFTYGTIAHILFTLNNFFRQCLEAGGEFKFTQFINIVFNYFNLVVIIFSIAIHVDLITILTSNFVITLLQMVIYYSRLKTGRWLTCVTDDVTIHSNLRGWKDKKLILQKLKDKKYLKQLRK